MSVIQQSTVNQLIEAIESMSNSSLESHLPYLPTVRMKQTIACSKFYLTDMFCSLQHYNYNLFRAILFI